MANALDQNSRTLGNNLTTLRKVRGLSQAKLAQLSGLPRSTLTYLESGNGNPTLQNLVKIAQGLNVGLEELLRSPVSRSKLVRAEEVPHQLKAQNKVKISKLLPDPIRGMEIDWLEFKPGARLSGAPHLPQTKEYFFCQNGSLEILVEGEVFKLEAGDILAFPGDQKHSYFNSSSKIVTAISVVTPMPKL